MAHYFFFSYAAECDGPALRRFFRELSVEVGALAALPPQATGFIDQEQQRGGQWDQNLSDALASTMTVVALYSPIYFTKEYCGREIDAMLRRRRKYRDQHPAARPANIIPVIWDPCERPHVPVNHTARTLPRFFTSRDRHSDYERHGLRFLIQTQKDVEYFTVLRGIALDVVRAATDFRLPVLAPAPSIEGLDNAFVPRRAALDLRRFEDTPFGPTSVVAIYVGPEGWQWLEEAPFSPPSHNGTGYVCAAVVQSVESHVRELTVAPASTTDGLDVVQKIRDRNGRVLVIVDGRRIATPMVRAWLTEFDDAELQNCATIIVGDTPRIAIEQMLPWAAGRPRNFLHVAGDADALADAVARSLQALHDHIAASADARAPVERSTTHSSLPSLVLASVGG